MRKKALVILIPLVIASVLFVLVYRHYNKEDKTTTLTVAEKKWVEKNKDKTYYINRGIVKVVLPIIFIN